MEIETERHTETETQRDSKRMSISRPILKEAIVLDTEHQSGDEQQQHKENTQRSHRHVA